MDANNLFDSEAYFASLCADNRLAGEFGFKFCTCSGIESLEGPLEEFRDRDAFVCLDDTNDGALFRGLGGGWYKKRTFTVFVLHRYEFGNMADRKEALSRCRTLFSQFVSRMIIDEDDLKNELIYLETQNILSRELGQYFLNGCTGLYFMIDVSEPVDLRYNPTEWQS